MSISKVLIITLLTTKYVKKVCMRTEKTYFDKKSVCIPMAVIAGRSIYIGYGKRSSTDAKLNFLKPLSIGSSPLLIKRIKEVSCGSHFLCKNYTSRDIHCGINVMESGARNAYIVMFILNKL